MNSAPSHTGLLLGGRYRLLTPLGAGGMAVVWQAHDHVLARTVAVKVVAPQQAGDLRARERIRHEARAAAALSHPNIAQVHDYGEMDDKGQTFPYVVMELVPGGTLQKRLAAGPVAPQFAMRVAAEIAAALAAAHAEGLVHHDIKPANVMLAPTGAKVVDFGIAAAVSAEPDPEVFGTPAYLAPERLAGEAVVPASDVYALGVVLYLLLTGRSPWTAENTRQMLEAHVYIEPRPLPPLPGVPDYVIGLCNRCLAKDPARRPGAQEAAAVLAHGAGLRVVTDEPQPAPIGEGVGSEPTVLVRQQPPRTRTIPRQGGPREPARTPAETPRGRRRLWWAAVAAGVLLIAGAAGWVLADGPRGTREPESTVAAKSAVPPAPPRPAEVLTYSRSRGSEPARTKPSASARTTSGTASAPAVQAPSPTAQPIAPVQPVQPVQRTFTSEAGFIEATCPSPGAAQILSWTPTKPYKVQATDPGPGAAAAVTFKHAKTLITMTVTCAGSTPAVSQAG